MNLYYNSNSNNHRVNYNKCGGGISTNVGNLQTNPQHGLFEKESLTMNKTKLLNRLNYILQNQFDGNVEMMAKYVGVSLDAFQNILSGIGEIPAHLLHKMDGSPCGDNIQIGDKIEINNAGIGYTNNYAGMINDTQKIMIQKMKDKISELEKLMQEKDKLLEEKDKIIAAQNTIIEAFQNGK